MQIMWPWGLKEVTLLVMFLTGTICMFRCQCDIFTATQWNLARFPTKKDECQGKGEGLWRYNKQGPISSSLSIMSKHATSISTLIEFQHLCCVNISGVFSNWEQSYRSQSPEFYSFDRLVNTIFANITAYHILFQHDRMCRIIGWHFLLAEVIVV